MNYLETMAIGINQGMYIEAMVRDFMEPIIREHVREIVEDKLLQQISADPKDFEHIFALDKRWEPARPEPATRYKEHNMTKGGPRV